MRNESRAVFNQYLDRVAELSHVPSAAEKFAVEPSVAQTLENKIQESSEFLSSINVQGVSEQQGAKLGLGVTGPIAGRTDTSRQDRVPRSVDSLDEDGYLCRQTNFDTYLTYQRIDAWAKFPDFQTRIRNAIVRQQALDRIMIGFNGKTAAVQTNIEANPLLQDVNIGWLQKMRNYAGGKQVKDSGNAVKAAGGDYFNLDALVFDVVNNLIDPWFRTGTDLVALVSRGLVLDKYFPIVNHPNDPNRPSEMLAVKDILKSQKTLGELPAVQVPFFPPGTILITSFDNLSIYWQEATRRRQVVDNAKRDRIENYESVNEAYVVEDFGKAALIEGISVDMQIKSEPTAPPPVKPQSSVPASPEPIKPQASVPSTPKPVEPQASSTTAKPVVK